MGSRVVVTVSWSTTRRRILQKARDRYPQSPQHRNAFIRGAEARSLGRKVDACPYGTAHRARGWALGYRAAWLAGWKALGDGRMFPPHPSLRD